MVAALIARLGAGFVVSLAASLAALAWPSEVTRAQIVDKPSTCRPDRLVAYQEVK
jgi:hypothetical protein